MGKEFAVLVVLGSFPENSRGKVYRGVHLRGIFLKGSAWLLQFVFVVGALLTLFVALTPQGRAGFHTALFLTQVLDTPVKPQSWFTGEPQRQESTYPSPEGESVAEIYRIPDGRLRAAVVLSLGVTKEGFEDPVVVNLGYALARAGFVVMYQWSPHVGLNHNIDPRAPEILVSSFRHLEDQEYVDKDRVGLGGFSVGASFALVAASDPGIRQRVHFVNALGPYYDAESLLVQVSSRTVIYDGVETSWVPDDLTIRVVANDLIETLSNSQDIEILSAAYDQEVPSPPRDAEKLSSAGRRVAWLLEGVGRPEAIDLVAALPGWFHEDLVRISPSAHLDGLQARLLLMHDREDRLVPAAESRRIAKALQHRGNFRHTELIAFEHVNPSGGGIFTILAQAANLYRHMYEVIRMAH